MSSKMQQTQELEAFCQSCPAPQEVTTWLHALDFTLVFHMPAVITAAYSGVAPLPAQYHYERPDGMSVIYLAGLDSAGEEGERLPPHASRWWAYAGADQGAFSRVTQSLSVKWSCTWRCLSQACQDVA